MPDEFLLLLIIKTQITKPFATKSSLPSHRQQQNKIFTAYLLFFYYLKKLKTYLLLNTHKHAVNQIFSKSSAIRIFVLLDYFLFIFF